MKVLYVYIYIYDRYVCMGCLPLKMRHMYAWTYAYASFVRITTSLRAGYILPLEKLGASKLIVAHLQVPRTHLQHVRHIYIHR